jgi:hypothetical protein
MFKMAFRVVYRIKGRCSRHPAYNHVKDEQGGIKGGCEECHALFHAYRAYLAFREAIEEFETTVQPLITNKKARENSVYGDHASAPESSSPVARWRTSENGNLFAPEVRPESRK